MSSITVIVGIVLFMAALIIYAAITQTVQRRNEQRKRLLSALLGRSRTFKFMLRGFPQGFLSKELTSLVHRSLADVSEQLTKLQPDEPTHVQDLQLATLSLSKSGSQSGPHIPPKLESHQQIKEVKACLEELNKFIVRLQEKNAITANQAASYRAEITQLVVQLSVDGYELHAEKAASMDKIKLAHHYCETALNLLSREGKAGHLQKRGQKLQERLKELADTLAKEDPSKGASEDELNEQQEISAEWDKMQTGDDLWKKKNVYD